MGIKENLAALMAQRQVSQYALARSAKVPQPTIARILSGESADPKTATVEKLATWFGVTVEELRGRGGRIDAANPPELTEEAIDVARAWMLLPAARRTAVRESIFILALAFRTFPWLGRYAARTSENTFEDWAERVTDGGPAPPAGGKKRGPR